MNKKVLASPSSFGQVGIEPIQLLKDNGYEIIPNPYGRKLTESEVIELAKDCVGIIAGLEPLNKTVMDALPQLRCISRVGIGMDNVDQEYARIKNIAVTNTPDGPTLPVAEFTLSMTMAMLRRIPQAHKNVSTGIWKKETGHLLFGKTVGVIGLGRIGKKVASIFKALGNPVIGCDLYPDNEWAEATGVTIKSIDEVLKNADIITLHVPFVGDKPLIDEQEFNLIKPGSFFLNISRGGIVSELALYNALKSNHLAGAAIDVYDEEPYNGPFKELDNVILTPHLGSYAAEGKLLMETDAVKNLIFQINKLTL